MSSDQTAQCVTAAILVLLIIAIAILAARRRQRRSRFTAACAPDPGRAPAETPQGDAWAPDERFGEQAVADVAEDLDRIATRADTLDYHEASFGAGGGAEDEARALLRGARLGLSGTLAGVRNLRGLLLSGDPRLNAAGLYSGLRTSDCALWEAARVLSETGGRLWEIAGECAPEERQKCRDAGEAMQEIGAQFYSLTVSVHRLGWALGLE